MSIKEVKEVRHTSSPLEFPGDDKPEIAFVGRSNVGKSSLLNTLAKRKKMARTSSIPGKTRAIYFYLVNNCFYLVDLPGYGYAKVSAQLRQSWSVLIEHYLSRQQILLLVHLVDIRHPPTAGDLQMANWLKARRIPYLVVATKADKVSRGQRRQHLGILQQGLGLKKTDLLMPFSAATGEGREELYRFISGALLSVGVEI